MTPYERSAAIIDAAAHGRSVRGFERVGATLVDLGRTRPIVPGAAITAPGVAAASTVSAPGRAGLLLGQAIKPLVALAVVAGVVVGPMLLGGGSGSTIASTRAGTDSEPSGELEPSGSETPPTDPLVPGTVGVERLEDEEAKRPTTTASPGGTSTVPSVADASSSPTSSGAASSTKEATPASSTASTTTEGATVGLPTVPSTITVPDAEGTTSTTSVPGAETTSTTTTTPSVTTPSTTTVSPTSTTEPPGDDDGDPGEPSGGDGGQGTGNGNGNGSGNGNGNGSGNGNGKGRNGTDGSE